MHLGVGWVGSYNAELLNPYYSNQTAWLDFKQHFRSAIPLQTSFLQYGLAKTVCLLFKCILGVEKHQKIKIYHSYMNVGIISSRQFWAYVTRHSPIILNQK